LVLTYQKTNRSRLPSLLSRHRFLLIKPAAGLQRIGSASPQLNFSDFGFRISGAPGNPKNFAQTPCPSAGILLQLFIMGLKLSLSVSSEMTSFRPDFLYTRAPACQLIPLTPVHPLTL